MLRHTQRLGLVMGLVTAVMLACAPPASAEGPSSNKTQNKKAQTKPAATPSDAEDGAAKETPGKNGEKAEDDNAPSGGAGKCTGKATFCGVYSSVFCNSQPGCSYSYASKMCMGIAMDCEKAENATFCEKIKGCAWK